MNRLIFALLLTHVNCVLYRPLGEPSNTNFNWKELYYPNLLLTVNVMKPLAGVSVTVGENPVETENRFTDIFHPENIGEAKNEMAGIDEFNEQRAAEREAREKKFARLNQLSGELSKIGKDYLNKLPF